VLDQSAESTHLLSTQIPDLTEGNSRKVQPKARWKGVSHSGNSFSDYRKKCVLEDKVVQN